MSKLEKLEDYLNTTDCPEEIEKTNLVGRGKQSENYSREQLEEKNQDFEEMLRKNISVKNCPKNAQFFNIKTSQNIMVVENLGEIWIKYCDISNIFGVTLWLAENLRNIMPIVMIFYFSGDCPRRIIEGIIMCIQRVIESVLKYDVDEINYTCVSIKSKMKDGSYKVRLQFPFLKFPLSYQKEKFQYLVLNELMNKTEGKKLSIRIV